MIVDNLKGRCMDIVARELARSIYKDRDGHKAWFEAVRQQYPAAAEKINGMSNMELLDLIADVLASD